MKILITGGAGFIGSNFVHYMLRSHPEYELVVLDKLTYAGRKENLEDILDKITFIKGDICDEMDVESSIVGANIVFNFAAETHVDRSIIDACSFVKTDVYGTYNLLEASRKHEINRYIQISTDEVYGSIESGSFKEDDAINPSSPYSSSKASADLLCKSYFKTYGLPVLITRSSNNYGPFQFPEKLVPVLIIRAFKNEFLPIYGKGDNIRDWLYVENNCEAIELVSRKGHVGCVYNIASGNEKSNVDVAKFILKYLNKPESMIKFVDDRPGHDFRYSIDCNSIHKLGWYPSVNFEEGMIRTIEWYKNNEQWWRPLIKKG